MNIPLKQRRIVLLLLLIGIASTMLVRQYRTDANIQPPVQLLAPTLKPSKTPIGATATIIPATFTSLPPTNTPIPPTVVVSTNTQVPSTNTPIPPTATFTPFPAAPLCLVHDNGTFHTLWNSELGCHYDHEHGESPFTQVVTDAFPDFNLRGLLGNVGVGHTNPSSPMENTHKHGGMKWQVDMPAPQGCAVGFEGGTVAVSAAVIQYHNFGNYQIEFESRVHSAVALLRQCQPTDPTDFGYIYTVQHVDYGQRVVPYQGMVAPYPDTPNPAYASPLGPYLTVDCVNGGVPQCRVNRQFILDRDLNTNSIWTTKATGTNRDFPAGSRLFALLFRVRDTYQVFDWTDQTYPFTFAWLCSNDGGLTYAATPGCRHNNSTSTVHEVQGTIPADWDNLAGFDTDARVGRITAEGYTTRFGVLAPGCVAVGIDCHPIKMVGAFVGFYSTELSAVKVSNPTPLDTPEREIFWCGGLLCAETDIGAAASGWIGQEN